MDPGGRGQVESFARYLVGYSSGSVYPSTSLNGVSRVGYQTRTSSYLNYMVWGKRVLVNNTVAA